MWIKEENKEIKTVAYWCSYCKIPIIRPKSENEKCPICSHRMKFLSNTLRPVFPAEEKFVELMTGKKFDNDILWKGKSTYFVNGHLDALYTHLSLILKKVLIEILPSIF